MTRRVVAVSDTVGHGGQAPGVGSRGRAAQTQLLAASKHIQWLSCSRRVLVLLMRAASLPLGPVTAVFATIQHDAARLLPHSPPHPVPPRLRQCGTSPLSAPA